MAEIDFDEWIKNYKPVKPKFFVSFKPEDGSIVGLYPENALTDIKHTVEIDDETATLIYDGKLQISSCYIDLDSGNFQIAEIKVLNKIDDVLHRIIDKKWATIVDEEDVYLQYNTKDKTIRFELSEKYQGTRKSSTKNKRKIHWDGSTVMSFLITDYNDPNVIYDVIKIKIDQLVENTFTVNLKDIPEKFSIYTKRIFPRYLFEEIE